jgi:hypothetical protein
MMTARELSEALGRGNMGQAVSVGQTAISNAVIRGHFPPSWFLAVKELADRAGVDCPPALFRMKASTSPSVDCSGQVQGAGQDQAPLAQGAAE